MGMDGVDHLVKLLATVNSNGWDAAFSEDVNYGGRLSDVENLTFKSYTEPLRSLRYSLEEAKLCMAALINVKARLTDKIRKLQKHCAPLVLQDGIERIPDEVLASIFEAGHQMSEHSKFALRNFINAPRRPNRSIPIEIRPTTPPNFNQVESTLELRPAQMAAPGGQDLATMKRRRRDHRDPRPGGNYPDSS
ncbi:hypothetical protein BD410DRAFT_903099 [Rickenella mellea]|uniref:Uncharacterized protein n=1 Tax=Rickenella mellea TaxID=50990 RepID=A0A4Y7PGU0_9AGAM|nr:hypothetical protein BD410DRAFT_903099 [Rickenella mellea]